MSCRAIPVFKANIAKSTTMEVYCLGMTAVMDRDRQASLIHRIARTHPSDYTTYKS